MTTRSSFKAAVATAVEALKATWSDYALVVEYDNRLIVDTQSQTNPFLCVHIYYVGGEQASLGQATKHHRVYGSLVLSAAVKEGAGDEKANDLLQHFYPSLHMTTIDGARTWGAVPSKERAHRGWVYYPVVIPFDFDNIS